MKNEPILAWGENIELRLTVEYLLLYMLQNQRINGYILAYRNLSSLVIQPFTLISDAVPYYHRTNMMHPILEPNQSAMTCAGGSAGGGKYIFYDDVVKMSVILIGAVPMREGYSVKFIGAEYISDDDLCY